MSVPLIVPDTDIQERLSEVELAYHRQVLAAVAGLAGLVEQIRALQDQAARIEGARDSWMAYQRDLRHLDTGDTIDADGYVHRRAETPPPPDGGGA